MKKKVVPMLIALFLLGACTLMVGPGFASMADYLSYEDDPFVATTCYIINATIVDGKRNQMYAFYLYLNVNFTANNLTLEREVNYAGFYHEKDATLMADRISSEGQIECFYQLWAGEIRVYIRSPSDLQTGLGLAITGCIALVGLAALGFITVIMIRKWRLQKREAAAITELICKATQGVSSSVDCAKKGADVQP